MALISNSTSHLSTEPVLNMFSTPAVMSLFNAEDTALAEVCETNPAIIQGIAKRAINDLRDILGSEAQRKNLPANHPLNQLTAIYNEVAIQELCDKLVKKIQEVEGNTEASELTNGLNSIASSYALEDLQKMHKVLVQKIRTLYRDNKTNELIKERSTAFGGKNFVISARFILALTDLLDPANIDLEKMWSRVMPALQAQGYQGKIPLFAHEITSWIKVEKNKVALQQLQKLDLSMLGLENLPQCISFFTGLIELNVSSNNLSSLPPEIGDLVALQKFTVGRGNSLRGLPERIGNLVALQVLDASFSTIEELPETIGTLKALQELDVSVNHLTRLPVAVGRLLALQKLDIGYNRFEEFPGVIGDLVALQVLDVRKNQLTKLPAVIGNLVALRGLNISFNQLRKLPVEIGNLRALEKFNVSSNELEGLPGTMDNLFALRELFIEGNNQLKVGEIKLKMSFLSAAWV